MEGLPYVIVNTISVVMYTKLGVSAGQMAFFTSLLMFPWVIKPLWGPLVDLYWTKRKWILLMQLSTAVVLGSVALFLQTPYWWAGTLIALSLAALISATQDIAIDGFYMVGLDKHTQTLFVGIRSTFYRIAMIFGQGVLIMLIGLMESRTGPTPALIPVHIHPKDSAVVESPAAEPGFVRFSPSVLNIEAGTTTSISVTMAEAPQTTTVVSLTPKPSSTLAIFFKVGPENLIFIKNAGRIAFGPDNWDKPVELVAEANENVTKPTNAFWQATAGNVQLTWTYCFAGLSGLFLVFLGFHSFALPKPLEDAPQADPNRPPFLVALGSVIPMVAVPLALFLGFYYGLRGPFQSLPAGSILGAGASLFALLVICVLAEKAARKSREGASANGGQGNLFLFTLILAGLSALLYFGIKPTLQYLGQARFPKLSGDVYSFASSAVLIVVVWAIYLLKNVRTTSFDAFRGLAKSSGIPFDEVFISYFRKPMIGRMVWFLLLYRLSEAMLVKMAAPFLLGPRTTGGVGLTQADYGLAYGTIGVIAMTIGGILGGVVAAKHGLKRWIYWMFLGINAPQLLYVYMAYARPESFAVIVTCISIEAFGYGFGFAAYMLYMIYIAGSGEHKTTHFALSTAFMALGMMLPGMVSGTFKEYLGWGPFFIFITLLALPGLFMIMIMPLDPEFGKKTEKES